MSKQPIPIDPHTGQPFYAQGADGWSIASLICGLAGALGFCCCPMRIVSIAAIICGHLALAHSQRIPGRPGRAIAVLGLMLGYGTIVLTIIFLALPVVSPEWSRRIESYEQRIRDAVDQHKALNPSQNGF